MEYEGLICRPSTERGTYALPVSVGCSYNRCKFCTFFKHLRYRLLPLEQIEQELRRVRDLGGNPEKVFLGDGNAFGMDTERLLRILALVREFFPGCRMVNMDCAVTDIAGKSDADLRRLRDAGVRNLYLGIECGLDDVLAFMRKDHDKEQASAQIRRVRDAGLSYNAHIMTGICGKGRGRENAEALAEFFNRTRPERIVNFSLFLHKSAPLQRDIANGAFILADEVENLGEAHRLLELLDAGPLVYDSYHDRVGVRVWGRLPDDRPAMLRRLGEAIAARRERAPLLAYAG